MHDNRSMIAFWARAPLVTALTLMLGACGPGGEGTSENEGLGETEQGLSICSYPVTTNTYKGEPDYWGTIVLKNVGASAMKNPQISFTVPSGVKCDYDASGWKHSQSGSTCVYSRTTSVTIKPGATYTFNFSTDSEASFTPASVTISDPSCTAAPPTPEPTVYYDFTSTDGSAFEFQQPYGKIAFGVADPAAHDQRAASLLWKANTSVEGPGGNATEIGTLARLGFGVYRFRARLATCQPSQELVNGFFVFQNDGADHDGDGLVDNNEIDIEILCGQPNFLNLASYSQYTNADSMRMKSRVIDLATGTVYAGKTDAWGIDENDPITGTKDPTLAHPGWYDPSAYYEMGWDWQADHLRWFIVLGGTEVTLWNFTDTKRVPQHAATMRFNVWYPGTHWNATGTVTPPRKDSTLSIDRFSFTAK